MSLSQPPALFSPEEITRLRQGWSMLERDPQSLSEEPPELGELLGELQAQAPYGGPVSTNRLTMEVLSTRTWINSANRDQRLYQLASQAFVAELEDGQMLAYACPHVFAVVTDMAAGGHFRRPDGDVLPLAEALKGFGLDPRQLPRPLLTDAEAAHVRIQLEIRQSLGRSLSTDPTPDDFLARLEAGPGRVPLETLEPIKFVPTARWNDPSLGREVFRLGAGAFAFRDNLENTTALIAAPSIEACLGIVHLSHDSRARYAYGDVLHGFGVSPGENARPEDTRREDWTIGDVQRRPAAHGIDRHGFALELVSFDYAYNGGSGGEPYAGRIENLPYRQGEATDIELLRYLRHAEPSLERVVARPKPGAPPPVVEAEEPDPEREQVSASM